MNTKPAVVIGLFLVLASAIIAFGPRLAPPSPPGSAELAQVKEELAQSRASVPSATAPGGKPADLKWARSIAEDFIRAVKVKDGKVAHALLSPDYRDRLTEKERREAKVEFGPFERQAKNADASAIFDAWSITGEELGPNGVEAKFTGKLTYEPKSTNTAFIASPANYPFTLLITRGKDSDLWRVNLFVIAREWEK